MGTDQTVDDDRALELRRKGQSFASIAKALGYERASEANDAFNRALRTRSADDQVVLRDEEQKRLDALATRVRSRDDLAENEINRQLRTIDRLREVLMADE